MLLRPPLGWVLNCTNTPAPSYSTNFPATENPISEGSVWTNGGSVGLDWTNVQTTPGLAFATQTIHAAPPYDDSIACLSGFPPDQWCQGVLYNNSSVDREVELLLRSTITAHNTTQYEVDIVQRFSTIVIARWNGALNDYAFLSTSGGPGTVSFANGAVWYAEIRGSNITVKCNGGVVLTASDSVLTTGSPGIGFFTDTAGSPTANNTFGWSSFSAGSL